MTMGPCPLSWSLFGVKRTSLVAAHMSACDPKRTLAPKADKFDGRIVARRPNGRSSDPTAVQDGSFGNVAPIYDQGQKLLIAGIDFFGEVVLGTGLSDHVSTGPVQFL